MTGFSRASRKGYKLFLFIFYLWVLVFPTQAQVYKSVNAQGKVEYSDKAPAAQNTKTLNLPDSPSPDYIQPDWQAREKFMQERWQKRRQQLEAEHIAKNRQDSGKQNQSECELARKRLLASREGRLWVSRGHGPRIKANTEADIRFYEEDAQRLCQ